MERPYKVFRPLDSGVPHTPPEFLQHMPLGEPPEDKDGFHFVTGGYNEDGMWHETWQKKWHPLGMTILYEKHGEGCTCSHCEKQTNKKWGIWLPQCRCRNAWRTLFWREGKGWPYKYTYIRVTLPRYPFVWWRCRRCRKNRK